MEHLAPTKIAIIGMSGRFPGAPDTTALWQNLVAGKDCISRFSVEELLAEGADPLIVMSPNFVNAGGVLDDIALFDAAFFGFSPADAETLDPQQRLFLEVAWESLEDAGYDAAKYTGSIGVFAGTSMSTYAYHLQQVLRQKGMEDLDVLIGNDKDFIATRTSYKMNLKGPSMTVQTACSTSLVAVCLGVNTLRAKQCDMVICGGATVNVPQKGGYIYREGSIASPDGICRAFDAAANGTVGGNGVAAVILKRFEDAVADGDAIYAVIHGVAMNNDGAVKVGYTAPGVSGQAEVLRKAWQEAGFPASTIGYIETHGTGTRLGDPIEIRALTEAYSKEHAGEKVCAIGSIKTSIGHLDAAAGVTGLIKSTLMLHHKAMPASLHFTKPNPELFLEKSPFYVNQHYKEWQSTTLPRRAAVSSFGIGGTNAHVVMEEAPAGKPYTSENKPQLLCVSARSPEALDIALKRLSIFLEKNSSVPLEDTAFTLQMGRKEFPFRATFTATDTNTAAAIASCIHNKELFSGECRQKAPELIFLFSGQGTQFHQMAYETYCSYALFKKTFDKCADHILEMAGWDPREILYTDNVSHDYESLLHQTSITQVLLFCVEYSLATLWASWVGKPSAMSGHSIGELVAAAIAEVFTLKEALEIVYMRGKLMQNMPGGGMWTVAMDEKALIQILPESLDLAATNGPYLSVFSGPLPEAEQFVYKLREMNIECTRLKTSHGFHSRTMRDAANEFEIFLGKYSLNSPAIPFTSNISGTWISDNQAMSAGYWAKQVTTTVRFMDGIQTTAQLPNPVFLEIGPGNTLTTLTKSIFQHNHSNTFVFSSLPSAKDKLNDLTTLYSTAGKLWALGHTVKWEELKTSERKQRVHLPTYPFERKRYWPQPVETSNHLSTALLEKLTDSPEIDKWFYTPSWVRTALPVIEASAVTKVWVVFSSEDRGRVVQHYLNEQGHQLILVTSGEHYLRCNNSFQLRFQEEEDYTRLFSTLVSDEINIYAILIDGLVCEKTKQHEQIDAPHFYQLVSLTRALAMFYQNSNILIYSLINNGWPVTGNERLEPSHTVAASVCRGISLEYPNFLCRQIDVDEHFIADQASFPRKLTAELLKYQGEATVAYRNGHRWSQIYLPMELPAIIKDNNNICEGGTYVITGGLGNIGLLTVEYLTNHKAANIILISRSAFPQKKDWCKPLSSFQDEAVAKKIQHLNLMENAGANIIVLSIDASCETEMAPAIAQIRNQYGRINGVFHGAGLTSTEYFSPLKAVSKEICEAHFKSKVQSLIILEKLLRDAPPDFYFIHSSLSSILSGLNFIPYAAANTYLDTFVALQKSSGNNIAWYCVNWDGWNFLNKSVAMANAINADQGLKIYDRIFFNNISDQLIVSCTDLNLRIQQLTQPEIGPAVENTENSGYYARPQISVGYLAPEDETEQQVANIWSTVLGITGIGIEDNFFELGGHSLLATRLVTRLRELFKVNLSIQLIFDCPTIKEMAGTIKQLSNDIIDFEQDEIKRALDQVEMVSEEELALLLMQQSTTIRAK